MRLRKQLKLFAALTLFAACAVTVFTFSDRSQIAQLALLFTPEPEAVEDPTVPGAAPETPEASPPPEAEVQETAAHDEFGFERGAYDVVEHRLKRHQTFSQILSPYNVSAQTISLVVEAARPVFDVRRIRAGQHYRIYREDATARYLVYQQDPINYVVFDLSDSVQVYTGQRPVESRQREVSGVITSSLYEALRANDVNPELVFRLAEVFAWQIDFYRIQRGDHFKVIYEERLVNGDPIGVGDIVAARFNHYDADYYAFYFKQDDFGGYYDEKGHSLRKALLKSPLKYSRMTSGYSTRRYHPVLKRYKAHLGTDYAAPTGTPILSAGDGVVIEAAYTRNNGNYVKIRHNTTYTTGYLHMSRIAKGIKPGARVQQGQMIGYVGSTGLATGPHVCYRFWKNGVQVDPRKEELPPSDPVKEAYRAQFDALMDTLLPRLKEEASTPELVAIRDDSVEM